MEKHRNLEWILLGLILLIGGGLRFAWIFYCDTVPVFDFLKYHLGAVSLASGEGYKLFGQYTAFEPIGFGAWLAFLYRVFGVNILIPKIANVLMGIDSLFIVYLLGRRYFSGKTGLLAAFMMSLAPRQILYTSVLSTEIIFTYVLLITLLLFSLPTDSIWKTLGLGVLGAILAFIKPFMLLFPGLALGFFLWQAWMDKENVEKEVVVDTREEIVLSVKKSLLVLLVMVICIFPWTLRNFRVFDRVIPISTNGGITLYLNNNDAAEGHWQDPFLIPGSPIQGLRDEDTGFWDELAVDELAGAEGKRWIKENPGRFFLLGWKKTYHVYKNASDVQFAIDYTSSGGPLVNRGWIYSLSDNAHKLLLAGMLFYLIMGVRNLFYEKNHLWGQGNLLMVWLLFSATFFVFEGQPRYLFPLVPVFLLLIAWGINQAANIFRQERER